MKLSPNFTVQEFLRSDLAARAGREIIADDRIAENLRRLCVEVIEPIRTHLGDRVITVFSGYRPDWLNKLAGGARTSEHMDGRAVDFIVQGFTPLQVSRAVLPILSRLPINQLIFEFGQWTHVSICESGEAPRRTALTAQWLNGTVSYTAGIIQPILGAA